MRRTGVIFILAFILIGNAIAQTQTPKRKSAKSKKSKRFEPPPEPPREIRGAIEIGPGGIPGGIISPPPEKEWVTITDPDNSFSILMPRKPEIKTQMADSPVGKIPLQLHISQTGVTAYAFAYGDAPDKLDSPDYAQKALVASRDKIIAQTNSKVLAEKEIKYEEFPGREIKYQNSMITALHRIYYVNNRIYQLQVIVPSVVGDPSDYSQRFFDSFKVLKVTEKNTVADNDLVNSMLPPKQYTNTPIEWREHTYTDAGVKALFPREPFRASLVVNPADKRSVEHTLVSQGEGTVMMISYRDLLADANSAQTKELLYTGIKSLINQSMKDITMSITAETDYKFKNYTGKEFKIESASGFIKLAGICRTVLVYKRSYTWMAIYPETTEGNAEAKKFLSSFQILDIPPSLTVLAPPPPKKAAGNPPAPKAGTTFTPAPPPPPPPAPMPVYKLEDWKPVSYPQAGFTAAFPTKPTERTKTSTRNGIERVSTEYKVTTQDCAFSVTVMQMPGQLTASKEQMKSRLDGVLKSLEQGPYKWLGGKQIELDNYQGIECSFEIPQIREIMRQRIFLTENRMYTITAELPSQKPDLKEPQLFMDSFKIIPVEPSSSQVEPPSPPTPKAGNSIVNPSIRRVASNVLEANAIKRVEPDFSDVQAHIKGQVHIAITVDENGKVEKAEVVSTHPLLREAALQAARQWEFKPTLLNNRPIKVQGLLVFNLKR